MSIEKAFENFIANKAKFKGAVDVATYLADNADNCERIICVELFPDSTYRVVRRDRLDVDYESPGVILEVPELKSAGAYEAAVGQICHDFEVELELF